MESLRVEIKGIFWFFSVVPADKGSGVQSATISSDVYFWFTWFNNPSRYFSGEKADTIGENGFAPPGLGQGDGCSLPQIRSSPDLAGRVRSFSCWARLSSLFIFYFLLLFLLPSPLPPAFPSFFLFCAWLAPGREGDSFGLLPSLGGAVAVPGYLPACPPAHPWIAAIAELSIRSKASSQLFFLAISFFLCLPPLPGGLPPSPLLNLPAPEPLRRWTRGPRPN